MEPKNTPVPYFIDNTSPIIYKFPKRTNKGIKLFPSDFIFDTNPNPKLIKYGFNQTVDKLDLAPLTNNSYYKNGLKFNFDRNDALSISQRGKKIFGLNKSINPKLFFIY